MRMRAGGADDEIVDTVPVDVPRRAKRRARRIVHIDSAEHEAAAAVAATARRQAREREDRREMPCRTEHDVAFFRDDSSPRTVLRSADEEIVDPIRVHVARAAHSVAREIVDVDTGEHETAAAVATAARGQARKLDDRREALGRAEYDIAFTGARISMRICPTCADD